MYTCAVIVQPFLHVFKVFIEAYIRLFFLTTKINPIIQLANRLTVLSLNQIKNMH